MGQQDAKNIVDFKFLSVKNLSPYYTLYIPNKKTAINKAIAKYILD
ncbi:MAG: hypothetical protein ACI9SJ_001544 [Flavobacteriaceae bacterium]